jgi:DNA-binding winged helix-turn-helix (wHTH) protein/tetratricopeptide (TPR) repeat protein
MLGADEPIALGPFRVSLATTRLVRDGVELELRPRAFRALKVLIQNPGRLVDYQQMIDEAWDGTHVSKHTVAVTIGEIKHVLGEYGAWIYCQPKFGYRLEIPESEVLIRRGWHYWSQCTLAGYQNALRCFQEAANADGADFRAFEGLSSTYMMLAGFLMRAPRDLYGPFLDAHQRAVALCGATPELRLDRAFARYIFERNVSQAESELLAIEPERPRSVHLYIRLALISLAKGRVDEAAARMRQAQATDALSPELAFLGIVVRLFARDFAAAVEWGKNTLDLHPAAQVGRAFYADALDYAGRWEESLAQYRLATALSPDILWIRADEARCLALHGRVAEAAVILEDLQRIRKDQYLDAYHIALLLDAMGKRDEAFEELERAFDENSYALLFARLDAKADGLKSDPRFAPFWNRIFGIGNSAGS